MPDFSLERAHWIAGRNHVAGLDEAGRGCLAGPVFAAAVILPSDANLPLLDDSKKLSETQRESLVPLIEKEALAIGVGRCSPAEIDELNILHAALEAMRRAANDLSIRPDALLVDGNRPFPETTCPQEPIIKGDQKSLSIAAASVIVKVTRDRLMVELHKDFPHYGWAQHKGYATRAHYAALAEHGPSPHHRQSFRLNQNTKPKRKTH